MAASSGLSDSSYLPRLDDALNRRSTILSWRHVYQVLAQGPAEASSSAKLRDHLSSPTANAVLQEWLHPLHPQSAATTSRNAKDFATLTSAGQGQEPDSARIQSAVKWLTDQTKLDQYGALRIVVLERLEAAEALLTGSRTIEDETGTIREDGSGPAPPAVEELSAIRQSRLLEIYLDERLHVVKVGDLLRRLDTKQASSESGDQGAGNWLRVLSKELQSPGSDSWPQFVARTEAAAARMEMLSTGSVWSRDGVGNAELESLWSSTILGEVITIFKSLAHVLQEETSIPPSSAVTAWFGLVAPVAFFKDVTADLVGGMAVPLLQSLTALISATLLRIEAVDRLDRAFQSDLRSEEALRELEGSYLYDTACISDITEILLDTIAHGPSPAAPALLAWSSIAMRIREFGSRSRSDRQQTITYPGDDDDDRDRRVSFSAEPDSIIERVSHIIANSTSSGRTFETLAAGAVDECQAHDVIATVSAALESALYPGVDAGIQRQGRSSLLGLLNSTASLTGYSAPLIGATIIVAGGQQRSWSYTRIDKSSISPNPFAQPESLPSRLMDEAHSRAPFELSPFLQLAKLSCQVAHIDEDGNLGLTSLLTGATSLTQVLPADFRAYDLPREDEDSSFVRLLEDLPLFQSVRKNKLLAMNRSQALTTHDVGTGLVISRGTTGVAIRDGRPLVVMWQHTHSVWQYLANVVSTIVPGSDLRSVPDSATIDLTEAGEVFGLFAAWLHRSLQLAKEANRLRTAKFELDQLLTGLRDGYHLERDIVNIATDIFEQQLQNHPLNPGLDGSLELLTNTTLFITGVAQVSPGRVWAHLARSQLLDLTGTGGALVAIEEATEMITGRYDFLIACIRLYEVLLQVAISSAVARKTATNTGRFSDEALIDSVQDGTISTILLAFTRTLAGLFVNSVDWRFTCLEDKSEVNASLMRAFGSVIKYTHGFDDVSIPGQKVTAVLAESAQNLLETFLYTSGSDMTARPVIQWIADAATAPLEQLPSTDREGLVKQASAALSLLRTLLRVSIVTGTSRTSLDSSLFKAIPVLARLYARSLALRGELSEVLEALVRCACRTEKEPPSLLGPLGEEEAKAFLQMLTKDADASEPIATRISVWRLLSAIVSCRQPSCATYLLSGSTPKEALAIRAGKKAASDGLSVLSVALEAGSKPATLGPEIVTEILRFVLLAQNHYPRVTRKIKGHADFLDGLLAYLDTLKRNPRERDAKRLVQSCNETRIAGLIGEILAMCIHHARQLGDYDVASKVTSRLAYFKEFGVAPPRYNTSLHTNLEKNLESKYQGVRLQNFRKTDLLPSQFGDDFCYDLDLAAELLDFDPSWSHEQSLRRELPLANIDLSLVEAQIELLGSWKLLATELAATCDKVKKVQALLISVTQKCLVANSSNDNPSLIYDRLVQTRADLAFALLQRLLNSSTPPAELLPVLSHAWDAVRASGVDFEAPFSGASSEYYRSLLKILYLSLKPHAAKPSGSKHMSQEGGAVQAPGKAISSHVSHSTAIVLEVLERVVCHGFRSLASHLHESPSDTSPADFVLITALLQSILSVHGVGALYQQLVTIFTSTGVVRFATSLFSWAEQLTVAVDGHDDPVYGELSALFLLELSTVQPMAETMAVEGILAQLSAAQLCQRFAQGQGAGPLDHPSRPFAVWSRGLVPLCLNLLGAVGAPVAAEVAAFLNQFAPQLARNVSDLGSRPARPQPPQRRGRQAAALAPAGSITLALATETHNLALVAYVLDRAREAGAGEGVVASDIPRLEWDRAAVREELQVWLSGRRRLAERIVATSAAEEGMLRALAVGRLSKSESRLEERIVLEFEGALLCLEGEQGIAGGSGGGDAA